MKLKPAKLLSLSLMLLMLGCASVKKYETTYPIQDVYRSSYLASVAIVGDDGRSRGSGTIIRFKKGEPLIVLTAAHVVQSMQEKGLSLSVSLTYKTYTRNMELAKMDEEADLAVLRGLDDEDRDGPAARVGVFSGRIGDEVYAIGSPLGHRHTLTTGRISNFITKKKILHIRMTAESFFGSSGGGVFNKNGELIGVVKGILSIKGIIFVPGGYFAVAAPSIRKIL